MVIKVYWQLIKLLHTTIFNIYLFRYINGNRLQIKKKNFQMRMHFIKMLRTIGLFFLTINAYFINILLHNLNQFRTLRPILFINVLILNFKTTILIKLHFYIIL